MITTARASPIPPAGHEPNAVNARAILAFAIALVVLAAVTHITVLGLQKMLDRRHPREDPSSPTGVADFSSATHWITPRQDLADLRAKEDEHLNTSGWIDQAHTKAHIPIETAMKLYAERARADSPPPQSQGQD